MTQPPRNFGSGKIEDNVFNSIIAKPYEICTETFIQIYPFDNLDETVNCDKYLKTKFARLMISIRKQDQGAGKDVYKYVPCQNFSSESSTLDWNLPCELIDKQLYSMYNLASEEIAFIEKRLSPIK
ncbi:hypothetical protein [Falsiporphyromonas endometrii]|uniref:Site-specific DNA-methyltransferase (adenine-specific) n=1 Tax=Falsiporphyromonas endometrii TaxID=1387297 RepID=A0ABV9K6N8_9PORP